jgi:23S rRNA (cytidine2498-2'-O)-methyltransferase
MTGAAYLAAEGFEAELAEELRRAGRGISAWHGRLALSPEPPAPCAWALDIWTAPRELPAPSVKAAADALRGIQRNWSLYAATGFRRAALIEARLPVVKARPLVFPEPAPAAPLGAWTLLAPDRLLASPTKTSPFVNGEVRFVEDREGPPSRAYLKLWEALTRLGRWPGPGERCLDLGAAPGGWSWALARLGAEVVAVDKAPLDPAVAAMPGVAWRQESAFGLDPRREEPVDWLCSDVICYPARLLALVRRWLEAGRARNLVCTVKFQGGTDHAVAAEFAAIPGAVLFHGAHNKHELMFCRLDPGSGGPMAGAPDGPEA